MVKVTDRLMIFADIVFVGSGARHAYVHAI